MTALFACDLDRTLIYTVRSVALGGEREAGDGAGLQCIERSHGEPISYVTVDVPGLLRRLQRLCAFVPVTTRSRGQYRRVELFTGRDRQPEWAVCANGGHILHNGKPDHAWHRAMADRLEATSAEPGEVARRIAALGDWVTNSRVADSLFAYALLDLSRAEDEPIADLGGWLHERGWVMSRQGRKLYAAPAGVDKWEAVTEVRRRAGATRLGAAGDSILDRILLDRADFSVRPPHGELDLAGYEAAVVVAVAGVRAGAAILRAAIGWVGDYRRDGGPDVRAGAEVQA